MSRIIKLFDTEIEVRDNLCSTNCNNYVICKPKLRLFIKATDSCNANCQFCGNANLKSFGNINIDKLKYVINYLKEEDVLHGVSITGGEPMLNVRKLNEIVNCVFSEAGLDTEVQISTNGYNFRSILDLDKVEAIEAIHLSRHHYIDEINHQIFGISTATKEDIEYVLKRLEDYRIIVLNCILMKSHIHDLREVKKYLDMASEIGVYKAGFVSLMQTNEYCQQNYIDFNDIFNNLDEKFLEAHHFHDYGICECKDGIYIGKDGKLIEYYARMTKDLNPPYARQLVYTSNNQLTTGFNDKRLWK